MKLQKTSMTKFAMEIDNNSRSGFIGKSTNYPRFNTDNYNYYGHKAKSASSAPLLSKPNFK